MQDILTILGDPMILMMIMIAILVILVAMVIFRLAGQEEKLKSRIGAVEDSLTKRVDRVVASGDDHAQRSREEMGGSIRSMGDSVTGVMNEMARNQQVQLDSFAGQLREIARTEEQRIGEMTRAMEERMGSYEARMNRIGDSLDDKLDKNEIRMENMRQGLNHQMESLRLENGQQLDRMRHAVDDQLTTTLEKRLDESVRQVSDRLEKVYHGLNEMQTLASGVGDLKRVLTTVRTHGLIGEIQLGALLAQIMSAEQYSASVVLAPGGAPVDYAVHLPQKESGDPAMMGIDAQFPQEAYQALLDAVDSGRQDQIAMAEEALAQAIEQRAAFIRENFICQPATPGFAVMFLPVEGLYAEALRRGGLVERIQRDYGVTIAGPATLTALLNSLQMGFRTLSLEKRSEEVWELLGAVRGEFADFAEALGHTQKRINQASESIEDVARKSRTIEMRLSGVKRIGEEPSKVYVQAPEQ